MYQNTVVCKDIPAMKCVFDIFKDHKFVAIFNLKLPNIKFVKSHFKIFIIKFSTKGVSGKQIASMGSSDFCSVF